MVELFRENGRLRFAINTDTRVRLIRTPERCFGDGIAKRLSV
jgi:hypothetical protein